MNDKCLLVHLPVSLSVRILQDWLNIKCLKNFDSACCERALRTELEHEAIRSDEMNLYRKVLETDGCLATWMTKDARASARSICIDEDKLENDEHFAAVLEYVTEHGKCVDALEILHRIDDKGGVLLNQIEIYCRSVTTLLFTCDSLSILHRVLKASPNLQELYVYSEFESDPTVSFTDVRLPKLRTLYCTSPFGIADCIRAANCVTKLNISETKLTMAEYIQLPMLMPQLRALCIASSPINDEAIGIITRHCPHIMHLDMYECSAVTDAGIESVVKNLKGLQSLCIEDCPLLTCHCLVHIYTHAAENLRTLYMCSTVEETSPATIARDHLVLDKLFETCHNIRSLGWIDCADGAAYTLPPTVCKLTSLKLGHSAISDSNMAVIADHCTHLVNLSLVHFNELKFINYTHVGLRRLAFGCPQLQLLAISIFSVGFHEQHPFVGLTIDLWRALRTQLTINDTSETDACFEFEAMKMPV